MDEAMEIFKRGNFRLILSMTPPAGLSSLLEKTVWGTRGFRYTQRLHTERIAHLPEAYHYSLYHGSSLIGNITFDARTTHHRFGEAQGYYVRYFAFHPAFQGTGKQERSRKSHPLLDLFGRVFHESPGLPRINPEQPAFYYAYVDRNNARSLAQASQFGFEPVRPFSGHPIFYRTTEPNDLIQPTTPTERALIRSLLRSQYASHNGLHFANLFYKNTYYALKTNKVMYGGCQSTVCEWSIKQAGHPLIQRMWERASRSPRFQKWGHPERFRFVVLDSFYTKPGYNGAIQALISHAMHKANTHWALVFMDSEDSVTDAVQRETKRSQITRWMPQPGGELWIKGIHLSDQHKTALQQDPWFISGFDLS